MKIAFIALALMLSASTEADELPTAVSGVNETNTSSIEEPLSSESWPLRWDEMDDNHKRAWLDKVQYPKEWDKMDNDQRSKWIDRINSAREIQREKKDKEYREKYEKEYQIRKQKEALVDAAREKEHEASKPKCTNIRFTGIATPPPYAQVIAQALASRDIEDTLARNPIQCRPNQFGNYVCTGIGFFRNQKGVIVDWNRDFFIVNSSIDFNTGRESIGLTIRRKDAVCVR